jgi:hypothetical protein
LTTQPTTPRTARGRLVFAASLFLALGLSCQAAGRDPDPAPRAPGSPFPSSASGYSADGKTETYDRKTVYKYMDGGAEVYLAYGMKALRVQRYTRNGEPAIVVDLFEMDSARGAYGAFTFEREDEEAGIGQGSEYGGGLLRFWRGRTFVFIQAEKETPTSREAILALGRDLAGRLGPDGAVPSIVKALPAEDLRPLSVRYVRTPLLLETLDPVFMDNPLGLDSPCEVVMGRYGPKGSKERVLIIRASNEEEAREIASHFGNVMVKRAANSAQGNQDFSGWREGAEAQFAILVLDAPDPSKAKSRCGAVQQTLWKVKP